MKSILFVWLMGLSSICIGQDYEKLNATKAFFRLESTFTSCKTNPALSKKKADRLSNSKQAFSYQEVDLIFVHVIGNNLMYNPVTPCRIVSDSTSKFGWYLVTLEELSVKGSAQACTNTWTPPLNQANFRLYEKACFDRIVIDDQVKDK
jgi:hypothetical protein